MKKKKYFITKDIWFASLLIAKGLEISEIENRNGVVFFKFQEKKKAEEYINDFLNNRIEVPARKFVEAYRNVKSLTFTEA